MANDITGFGSAVSLIASNTYPAGIAISQFADDADAFDMASVKIADTAMGVNGDLIKWSRAVGKPITISVVPGSLDDTNLAILAKNNDAAQGQVNARDEITITVVYPDGSVITFANGFLTDAPFGNSLSSSGRLKSKTYSFMFQTVNGAV
ncbi:phage tail fiber protein [Singulisphaera rosea]